MIILYQIIFVLAVVYVSFRVGYVIQESKKYVKEKKRIQPCVDLLKILNNTVLKDSYFIRRINNIVYFNINGTFLLLYTKSDFSYLTFYKDVDFDNILYTPYFDDLYKFSSEEESKLINKLLEFYHAEINNTVMIGNLTVDIKYGEQYTRDLIATLDNISKENNLNIDIKHKDDIEDIEDNEGEEYKTIVVDTLSEQEKLDIILDQINIKGINSLSTDQQKFLKNQK